MKKRILAFILIISMCPFLLPSFADTNQTQAAAENLYALGLMKGTGKGFELAKPLTQQEAIVLIVRLLGKEQLIQAENYSHPFSDVSSWAAPYVAYAYDSGIVQKTVSNKLGASEEVTAAEFLNSIFLALNYVPATDYDPKNAFEDADRIGFTHGEYSSTSKFLRGDAAIISNNALSIYDKAGDKKLLDLLYEQGAITAKAIADAGLSDEVEKGFARVPLDSVTGNYYPLYFYGLAENVFAMEYLNEAKTDGQFYHGIVLFNRDGAVLKIISLPVGYWVEGSLRDGKLVYTCIDKRTQPFQFKTIVIDSTGQETTVTKENGFITGLPSPDGDRVIFTLDGDLYLTESGKTTSVLQKVEYVGNPKSQYAFCWTDNSHLAYYTGSKNNHKGGGILNVDAGEGVTVRENSEMPIAYGNGKLYLMGEANNVLSIDTQDPTFKSTSLITQGENTEEWVCDGFYGVSPDNSKIMFAGSGKTSDGTVSKFRIVSLINGEILHEASLPSNTQYRVISFDGTSVVLYTYTTNEMILMDLTK